MSNDVKVVVYIAASIDGYIAADNDDLSFLASVEKEGEDYGYADFVSTIDTVIMGRKTYEKVLSFGIPYPHSERKTYVITRTHQESKDSVEFYNGNLSELVSELKSKKGKNVFVDGGAQIVNEFLKLDLVDEIIVSYVPVVLGSGTKLFHSQGTSSKWKTKSAKQFETGLVQIHWERAE
ncbi:MAG TPA: dihydrofolate reductase family protein [Bacteroidia bacterium]